MKCLSSCDTYFNWPALFDCVIPFFRAVEHPTSRLYILGRCTTMIFGLLTVWLLYPVGRRLYGRKRTGLLAALFLGFT